MFLAERQPERNLLDHERTTGYFHEFPRAVRIIQKRFHLTTAVAVVIAAEAGFKDVSE